MRAALTQPATKLSKTSLKLDVFAFLLSNFYVLPALSSHFSVLSKFCIMNTLSHFFLLCQSCRSLRSVGLPFGGRILGLIKVLITVG